MNLHHVTPTDDRDQRVSCHGCGARVALSSCMADLDGPAFQAYYCDRCVAEIDLKNAFEIAGLAGFSPTMRSK